MKLRTAIQLAISAALAVALLVTVLIVSAVLDNTARRELAGDLSRGRAVFEDLLRYRMSLHRAESRVLADEPRLKAVVATDDVTRATVQGVISDLRRALRCDLLLLTDRGGRLIADAAHPDERGDELYGNAMIATTLDKGEAEGIWLDGTQVFQVHGRRLQYGAMTVGAVVVGYRIDDAMAQTVERQIAAGVIVSLGGSIVASSHFVEGDPLAHAAAAAAGPINAQTPLRELSLGHSRYLMTAAPLPLYNGELPLRYALFRSLDGALAPARNLVRILIGIAVLALLLALVGAVWLARRLARPVDDLVAFTQRIAAGTLTPIEPSGMTEVRTLGSAMNRMVEEVAASRIQIAEKTRLAKELEIAQRIQTSILPHDITVPGLSVQAEMVPASEVGGDYYDLIPQEDGCWMGIGDVAGHGLPAGMVMFMVQSTFSTLVRSQPDATPRMLVLLLNQFLYDNVRNRLHSDEHVTFTAARYFQDGRIVFAGAHETMLVLRNSTKRCEHVETPGTWLGIIEDVSHATVNTTLQLERGDVVVLYSDGVTEAMNEQHQQFGIDRLSAAIERCAGLTVTEMHAHILDGVRSWAKTPDDDITLLVLRHEGLNDSDRESDRESGRSSG